MKQFNIDDPIYSIYDGSIGFISEIRKNDDDDIIYVVEGNGVTKEINENDATPIKITIETDF